MEIDESFALHITWTCYGTRLPCDPRGYVSNTLVAGRGYEHGGSFLDAHHGFAH